MARPLGSQNKDKPFRDALRMELGEDLRELRPIARRMIRAAKDGDMSAAASIADRLDGKPAQEQHINVTDERERLSDAELRAFVAIAIAGVVPLRLGNEEQEDKEIVD